MDSAQLSTIYDPDVLRALVVEKLEQVASRDRLIAARNETIRNRDIQIEALTREIARLRRVILPRNHGHSVKQLLPARTLQG